MWQRSGYQHHVQESTEMKYADNRHEETYNILKIEPNQV